jgi:hypothetical protein
VATARKAATAAHKRARTGATQAAGGLKKTRHRRARATPMAASIDATGLDAGVLVFAIDDILTKNERDCFVRGGKIKSPMTRKYHAAVLCAANAAGFLMGARCIRDGVWRLDVLSVWPTERHENKRATGFAFGDSDAAISMVKDALQTAGIIDNDMRIVQDRTFSAHAKGVRRTVAVLTRVDPAQHVAEVAAMLARAAALPC